MMRRFLFAVWVAIPLLWLARIPLFLGVVLFTIPMMLSKLSSKAALRLLSWNDHLEDAIKRAWSA